MFYGDLALLPCTFTLLVITPSSLTALPTYPKMRFEDGSPVNNASVVGPFDEGATLTLSCESGGGKPVARVSWWNGTQELTGKEGADGPSGWMTLRTF